MTISEAITNINSVKPNAYTAAEKVAWLYTLDLLVKKNILDMYTEEVEDIEEYTTADQTAELLVPAPWDKIYEHYMAGEIDRLNGETDLYNNDTVLFNRAMADFRNAYNRAHEHKRAAVMLI